MRRIWSLLGITVLLTAACDDKDDPSGPQSDREYSATVTGALSESIEGPAFFGTDTSEGEPVFVIGLGSQASEHVIALVREGSARPGVGSYDISDPFEVQGAGDFTAIHIVGEGDVLVASFIATSGTLTITESTTSRLRGTFQYEAEGFIGEDSEDPVTVTVSGSFDAGHSSTASFAFRKGVGLALPR